MTTRDAQVDYAIYKSDVLYPNVALFVYMGCPNVDHKKLLCTLVRRYNLFLCYSFVDFPDLQSNHCLEEASAIEGPREDLVFQKLLRDFAVEFR